MREPKGMQTFFRVLSKAGRMRSWAVVLPRTPFWEYQVKLRLIQKILHCVAVKAQGHIRVQHGNTTVGFSNAYV